MSRSHTVLKTFRQVHLYLGMFTAPALIFFAFTGALQTFSLHETTQGSSYKPPAWIATLAQLHKKQTTTVPVRKQRPPEQTGRDAAPKPDRFSPPEGSAPAPKVTPAPDIRPKSHLPMKIFFLIVSVGLFLSTATGIYMAYRYDRRKWLLNGLLAVGTVLPLLLLPF